MNVITEARTDLKAILEAAAPTGTQVHDHVPEALSGRDVVIQPGQPLITPAQLDDQYAIRLNVVCITTGEDNAGVHRFVDEHLSALIPALVASPWEYLETSLTRITTYSTSEWGGYGVGFDVEATYAPPVDPEE